MAKQPELTARSGFVVSQAASNVSLDQQVLSDFYQPIIGPAALGLLMTLWSVRMVHPQASRRRPHSDLLMKMNIGLPTLRSSLQLLEAVGLIKAFYRKDEMGDCFIYEIQPMMTVEEFINDPIMSVLLLDSLGESSYKALIDHYRRFQMDTSQFQDISAKILDVFHLNADEDGSSQKVLDEVRQNTKVNASTQVQLGTPITDFDMATLMTLLGSAGPSEQTIRENQELIKTEHVLYGIDEPTMAKLILRSTDLHNNFDPVDFKRQVAKSYPRAVRDVNQKPSLKDTTYGNSSASQHSNLPMNNEEKALVVACQKYSPNDFLAKLKNEAGGGYVSPAETNIMKRLIDEGKLPAPVINLLSWYVIAQLGHGSLTGSFVDAIANTWIRAGVKTVTDGLDQIYQYYQKQQQRSSKPRKFNKFISRKEAQPKWKRDEQAGKKVKKTSAKQEAEIKKLLASLHKSDNGR